MNHDFILVRWGLKNDSIFWQNINLMVAAKWLKLMVYDNWTVSWPFAAMSTVGLWRLSNNAVIRSSDLRVQIYMLTDWWNIVVWMQAMLYLPVVWHRCVLVYFYSVPTYKPNVCLIIPEKICSGLLNTSGISQKTVNCRQNLTKHAFGCDATCPIKKCFSSLQFVCTLIWGYRLM